MDSLYITQPFVIRLVDVCMCRKEKMKKEKRLLQINKTPPYRHSPTHKLKLKLENRE